MAEPQVAVAETTIMDLPYEVKLKIFGLLEMMEKKVVKLVCPEWYHIVNDLPYSFELNSRSISVLKNWMAGVIPKVVVFRDKVIEELPIHSSTRIGIPKAKALKLDSCENSPDNTMKLIRYYASHCKLLDLSSWRPYFQNVASSRMKNTIALNNLVELKLFLLSPFGFDLVEDLNQHCQSLAQFLLSVQLPSLQVLEFGMQPCYAEQDPVVEPAEVADNNLARSNRVSKMSALKEISAALDIFLKKYSKQIRRLVTFMPTLETLRILTEFSNLQWFELVITRIPNGRDTYPKLLTGLELSELLGKVKALNSLKLKIFRGNAYNGPIILEFIHLLFAACSKNLEIFAFLFMDTLSGPALLDWLYDFELRKLTKLELKGMRTEKIPLEKALLKRTKLQALKELTLGLKDPESTFAINGEESLMDWRRDIVKWIVELCPNLVTLKLDQANSRFGVDLEHIYSLIVDLNQLKTIHIGPDLKVRSKVEYWFTKKQTNSSVKGQWSGRGNCNLPGDWQRGTFEIRITRPLLSPNLPKGFRSLV